ncbi:MULTISPECIES: LiaF transmembrane domain-containing protein [Haloarcula]|uniref:Cell wall-active antibiotics response LiaF-like C-terminal domain-containing protein n=1 Tax=Haloarcula pellucida TaxID=1427151 RepID=A0A830GGG5_9EURY|nr:MULTISPECIES: LiaF domain-containing protein [Halomicroarcula]MBX0346683.1 cell wall-active antibiotics response protein [Halomicroarcula pellucida]MDS0277460.1 cell wall-active antibiotics response protein [Halomicroarcula sp. S1AR25-4]GGN85020.1 hypothetical protein GCM10009030_01020 [Halomicroarcula pellucida]
MEYRTPSPQTLVGVLVVLVGAVLLGQTTGLYPSVNLLRFVPSLFVFVGLYALVTSGLRNVTGPLVVVLLAGAWQAVALGYLVWGDVWQFWPLVVVLFGVSLLLGQFRTRARETTAGTVTGLAVFGGSEQRSASQAFRGADLTAIFGGAELDLRDAAIPEGETATINATAIFGGVEVVVPREWNVRMDVLPILGAAADERTRSPEEHEAVDLVVTGLASFGGVSVTS